MATQLRRRYVIDRLRVQVVPTLASHQREIVRVEQFRPRQVERVFFDLGASLDEKLVQRFPEECERLRVIFDAASVPQVCKLTGHRR